MKNLNKVLAFVIAFTMMLGFAVSAATFPDVADDASYAEAVTILSSLKIMIGDDEGNFNPDKTITRAEVTAIIVRTKGLEDAAQGAKGTTSFSDVPANHWATGYINIASQSGIVAGFPDGTFRPEDPVTYEQVTKMIVAALGYTPKAENMGGYPTGYLVIASQEGISKGAMAGAGEPAKRSIVARLVFNALEVDIMEQTGWTIGAPEYSVIEGKTLLSNFLKVDKYEGIITSTYLTKDSTTKDDDSITIRYLYYNKEKLNSEEIIDVAEGETNAADLFGYYVIAYVAEDETTNEDTLLAIAPKQGRNKTLTLDYSQLEGFDSSGKVEYYAKLTDSTKSRLTLEANPAYYLNGRANESEVEEFLEGNYPGVVTFIDNNNDDEYDYVLVTKYGSSYVVKEIDAENQRLTDINGGNIPLYFDEEDVIIRLYNADGTKAAFEDIEVDDILTFAASDDYGSLINVYISKNIVTGTVTEKRTGNDGEVYYTINGNEYRLDSDPNNVFAIDVSEEGKFYLNIDNRIVYKDTVFSRTYDNYAFLHNAAVETSIGKTVVRVRFITASGEWKTADLASTVTVYGPVSENGSVQYKSKSFKLSSINNEESLGGLFTVAKGTEYSVDDIKPQLFQYQLNGSGEIYKIYVVGDSLDETNRKFVGDSSVFSLDAEKSQEVYQALDKRLSNVWVQDDTIVFTVPAELKGIANYDPDDEGFDEDKFFVSKASSVFKDANPYTINAYDIDDGYPRIVVAYGAQAAIALDTNLLVITRVTQATNDGVEVTKFYGYQNGVEVEGETAEGTVTVTDREGDPIEIEDINRGDVVIFNTDAKGKIDKIQVLISAKDAADIISRQATGEDAQGNDIQGFWKETTNSQSGKKTLDIFGYVSERLTNGRIVLSKSYAPLKQNRVELETVTLVRPNSNINIYEVNLVPKTPTVRVSDYGRLKVEEKEGREGYYLYVRMFDGAVVDAVAFIGENVVDSDD